MSEQRMLDQKVTNIIREIGIPAHLKGYYYVRDAIMMVNVNDDFMGAVTTKLYPLIAEKYHISASRVERGIRHCLGIACSRGNINFISHLFGSVRAKQRITNKEFIVAIADRMKTA